MATNHLPRRVKDTRPKPVPRRHPNIVALFEKRYRVIMNQMDIVPLAERREFGTYSSGNHAIDKAAAESYITVMITINDMIENYMAGIPMRLERPDDSKPIYEAIIAHTSTWRQALQHVMNVGKSPVEDLIVMENFAGFIYDRAKFVYVEKPKTKFAQGSLAEFLYSNRVVDGNMFNSNRGTWSSSGAERTRADVRNQTYTPNIGTFRDILVSSIEHEEQ